MSAEAVEFSHDDLDVFDDVRTAAGVGDIEQVHQQARALDVAEKLHAQASAFVSAFDQARDVGDHEADFVLLVTDRDDAEIRLQSGEGVVGDFGAGGGDAGDQRGLADVGIADQADISEEFEFEAEDAFLAGTSFFVLARSLMGGGRKACVATAASAPVGDDDALVGMGEVPDFVAGFLIVDDGADGDFQDNVGSFAPGFVGAFAVASALGLVFGIEAEMHERVVTLAGFHDDVAAFASVATGGASSGDEFLAAEGQAAVATVACFDSNCGFVDEHGSSRQSPVASRQSSAGG